MYLTCLVTLAYKATSAVLFWPLLPYIFPQREHINYLYRNAQFCENCDLTQYYSDSWESKCHNHNVDVHHLYAFLDINGEHIMDYNHWEVYGSLIFLDSMKNRKV